MKISSAMIANCFCIVWISVYIKMFHLVILFLFYLFL